MTCSDLFTTCKSAIIKQLSRGLDNYGPITVCLETSDLMLIPCTITIVILRSLKIFFFGHVVKTSMPPLLMGDEQKEIALSELKIHRT